MWIYSKLVIIQIGLKVCLDPNSNEEFELTANSLGSHIEKHGKLILTTLSYLTVNSQDDSHCELDVSFP